MSGVGDKSSKITKDAQGRLRDAKGRFTKKPKGGGNDLTGKGSLVDSFNKIDMTKVLKGARRSISNWCMRYSYLVKRYKNS